MKQMPPAPSRPPVKGNYIYYSKEQEVEWPYNNYDINRMPRYGQVQVDLTEEEEQKIAEKMGRKPRVVKPLSEMNTRHRFKKHFEDEMNKDKDPLEVEEEEINLTE